MKAIGALATKGRRGPTSAPIRRWLALSLALGLALGGAAAAVLSCGNNEQAAPVEGGTDAAPLDLCDAFTGVGTACPRAGPFVCFPMCEAGGCFCSETPDGPQWRCVTDRSCEQVCAPIDDACAGDAGSSE
jgi:hypothetical protein